MVEETNKYEGAGLRGPVWTLAGTAIGGLAMSLMNSHGILGGGNTATQAANTAVAMELAEAKSKIAILEQNASTRNQLTDVLYAMDKRLTSVETALPLREQIVLGQVQSVATAVANIQNTLNGITKCVVPNTSVCPGWGAVTITPASSSTAVVA